MAACKDPPCPTLIARGYALDEIPCRCPAFSRFISVRPPYKCDACGRLVDFKAPKNLPPDMVPPYRCLPSPPSFRTKSRTSTPACFRPGPGVDVDCQNKEHRSGLRAYLDNLIKGFSDPCPDSPEQSGFPTPWSGQAASLREWTRQNQGPSESDEEEDPDACPCSVSKRTARSPLTASSRISNRRFLSKVRPGPYLELERRNLALKRCPWEDQSKQPCNDPTEKCQVCNRESRHKFCSKSPSVMTRSSSAFKLDAPDSAPGNPLRNWRLPGSPELTPGVDYFRRFRPGCKCEFRLDQLPSKRGGKGNWSTPPVCRPVREKRPKKCPTRMTKFDTHRGPWNPHFRNSYMQMSTTENMRVSTERLYGTNTYLGGHKVFPA